MTDRTMTPEEFGAALDLLIAGTRTLITLPLDAMTEYVERVETLGDGLPDKWTPERIEATTVAARLIAAAQHVKVTAQIGGTR